MAKPKTPNVQRPKPLPPAPCSVAWIDADDQMPDSDTTVMIYCPGGMEPVWLGYHDGETWRCIDGYDLETSVTHWAEMPEPPNDQAQRRRE